MQVFHKEQSHIDDILSQNNQRYSIFLHWLFIGLKNLKLNLIQPHKMYL